MNNQYSATEQPNPIGNGLVAIWEEVIKDFTESYTDSAVKSALLKDMTDRDVWGRSKYGVPLQPFNGRDSLVDMYQEFLDAIVYTKQYQIENPNDHSLNMVYLALKAMIFTIREKLLMRGTK